MGEVAENNKLIAKFMGYKEIDDDKFTIQEQAK